MTGGSRALERDARETRFKREKKERNVHGQRAAERRGGGGGGGKRKKKEGEREKRKRGAVCACLVSGKLYVPFMTASMRNNVACVCTLTRDDYFQEKSNGSPGH